MKMTRVIAIAVIAASLGLVAADAKTLRNADEPAEFPPASYKGKQYVDSRGCVYIRAGIDGLVTWVPRVARNRTVICGAQPTFAKAPVAKPAAPAKTAKVIKPKPKPAAKPAAIKAKPAPKPKAAPKKVVRKAKPTPKRVVKAKPVPQHTRKRLAPKRPAPKRIVKARPKPVVVNRPAPVATAQAPKLRTPKVRPPKVRTPKVRVIKKPVPATAVATRKVVTARKAARGQARPGPMPKTTSSCAELTGISHLYGGSGSAVRCGPQADHPGAVVARQAVTVMRGGKQVVVKQRVVRKTPAATTAAAQAPVTGQTRVVPGHVYTTQQETKKAPAKPPRGYRTAWNDDRLNDRRAHQTLDGMRKTDLVWTRTVPRKLYERHTGRVVNHLHPKLVYPYTSMEQQRAATLSAKGKVAGRPTKSVKKAVKTRQTQQVKKVVRKTTGSTATKPRVSTRTTSKATGKAASRYVQVGTFGVPANARNSAARLKAAGLPVRTSTFTRKGKQYQIVLAGPFKDTDLGSALNRARKAGFRDAFVRK
ncbi:MAG: hypothetical protein CSA70_06230 [Rhodobacterales bacterium]|nr:MAG: hypothetical protein CSA70_06230 [Rhodobacterales bacterium]